MDRIIPDIDWYRKISQELSVPTRCPFSTVDECPRYYQSLSLLSSAGHTAINPEKDEKLKKKWEKSDLWPLIGEQATSVSGAPGRKKSFSNFCPEVVYESFRLFASDLFPYHDETDHDLGIKFGVKEKMPNGHWIFDWAHVSKMHYTECPIYSPLKLKKEPQRDNVSLLEKIQKKAKNNQITAIFLFIFIIFAGIATFTDSLTNIQIFLGIGEKSKVIFSYKNIVLQEVQDARDYLAYSIVTFDKSWTITLRDMMWQKEKIPEIFADDIELSKKVQKLYVSLSTGLNHVSELRLLLRSKQRNETEVNNIVQAIKNIINYADEVGPLLAKSIESSWDIPPNNLSNAELVNYYVNRSKAQDATGEQVQFKFK